MLWPKPRQKLRVHQPTRRILCWVEFSPLTDRVVGGLEGRFRRDPLSVCSAGSHREQFWHGQGCPLFDVVHPAFPFPTTASPTFQSALKDDFGEAVLAYVICPSHAGPVFRRLPDEVPVDPQGSWSCSAHSRWSCAPSRRYGEVSIGTRFRKPGSFFRVSEQCPLFTAIEEAGGDKRLVELELACKADGVAPPDPV